jgi:NTE family protein
LKRLLAEERYEVVALSGTSGGAICAVLAWYALLKNGRAAARAAELLDAFWKDNSAREVFDAFWNEWLLWLNRSQGSLVLPAVSP